MLVKPHKSIEQILHKHHGELKNLLLRSGKLKKLSELVESYLPEPLNNHCRVFDYRQGSLILATSDPHWAHHLRFVTSDLLSHLRQHQGLQGIAQIKTKVMPIRTERPYDPKRSLRPAPAPNPAAAQYIQETAAHLQNDELQQALRQLAQHVAGDP